MVFACSSMRECILHTKGLPDCPSMMNLIFLRLTFYLSASKSDLHIQPHTYTKTQTFVRIPRIEWSQAVFLLVSDGCITFHPFTQLHSRSSTIQQGIENMYCTTNKKGMQTIHDPHPVVYAVLVDVVRPVLSCAQAQIATC